LTPTERFWSNVERRGPTRCWPWKRKIDRKGYGVVRFGGRQWRAHRLAFSLFHGNCFLPSRLGVCHSCDNPACCNPDHLWLGTQADNAQDAIQKGRFSRGSVNGMAKLSEDKVRQIRASGERYADLASRYGVCTGTIEKVRAGERWAHVE
jgi:hypothetical protein